MSDYTREDAVRYLAEYHEHNDDVCADDPHWDSITNIATMLEVADAYIERLEAENARLKSSVRFHAETAREWLDKRKEWEAVARWLAETITGYRTAGVVPPRSENAREIEARATFTDRWIAAAQEAVRHE